MKPQDDPLANWKRPKIVVRKRTVAEIRDLAIRVLCAEFKPLAFYFSILAIPMLLLDYLLWALVSAAMFGSSWQVGQDVFDAAVSLFWLAVVVFVTVAMETGFVGSLVTEYLGAWLFDDEKIQKKYVFRAWRERWFQVFYYLLLTRPIRTRAFYPETILLERHPFVGSKDRPSTGRRVRNINSGGVGAEAFSSFLATELFVSSGVLSGWGIVYYLVNALMDEPVLALYISTTFVFPAFYMATRLFNVVYNFCYYVNYRISCEGWDVDLAFKTEIAKLGGEIADLEGDGGAEMARPRSKTLGPLVLEPELGAAPLAAEAIQTAPADAEGSDENKGDDL